MLETILVCAHRWHIWHNLAEAANKEVTAQSACWAHAGPPIEEGKRAATNLERWHHIHDLLGQGIGLLECARRLNLALNAVKRYAREPEPECLIGAPAYRPTLADPYREHLRKRRAEDPAVPTLQLLTEIKALGYTDSQNLFYRYITQGRVESARSHLSPRRAARLLVTKPENLSEKDQQLAGNPIATRPEMTALTGAFAPTPATGAAQRRAARRADHRGPRRRPAPPPSLHRRPGLRQRRRSSGPDAAVSQWRNRGREH